MGIWIRAFIKDPFPIEAASLARMLDHHDWFMFAENNDLDDEEGPKARKLFRVEALTDVEGGYFIRYTGDDWFIRADHWRGAMAKDEIDEVLEEFELPDVVRELLPRCRESFAFELKLSDTKRMGWPICFYLAMEIAKAGNGVVDADGTWWDPNTFDSL